MRLESAGLAGKLCKNAEPSQQLRLKVRSREGRGDSGGYCGLLMKVPPLGNHTQGQERLQRHDEDSDFSEPEMHAISSALEIENIEPEHEGHHASVGELEAGRPCVLAEPVHSSYLLCFLWWLKRASEKE